MDLATVVGGAGGAGIVFRIVSTIIRGIIESRRSRDEAINQAISNGKHGTYNPDLDPQSRDTANIVVYIMCFFLGWILLIVTLFPGFEIRRYLPSATHTNYIDLFLFRYTWSSDLENSIVVTTSGDIIYAILGLITFVITALYNSGNSQSK